MATEPCDARELPDIYAGESAESAQRSLDGGERGQRINRGALRAALDGALTGITPTLPLAVADTVALFDLVRPLAPSPLIREVFVERGIELVVRVFDGKQMIYERRLAAH